MVDIIFSVNNQKLKARKILLILLILGVICLFESSVTAMEPLLRKKKRCMCMCVREREKEEQRHRERSVCTQLSVVHGLSKPYPWTPG